MNAFGSTSRSPRDMALRMKESNERARRETGQHARKVEVRKDSFGDGRLDKRKGFATNVCGLPGTALHGGSWQQAADKDARLPLSLADESAKYTCQGFNGGF